VLHRTAPHLPQPIHTPCRTVFAFILTLTPYAPGCPTPLHIRLPEDRT
jgi:hypothetical protein